MPNYIVTYDLNAPGQNYNALYTALEAYPNHWHYQESAWIIGPSGSAYDVAESIRIHLDTNDTLFVTRVTEDSAWWNFDDKASDWFRGVI